MHPIIYQDQFSVQPNNYYHRIISLVPSQTELLSSFGIDERVVGITQYCVHPQGWLQTKAIIGGTKKLNIDTIKTLQPDLIIANKEENVKEQVETLAAFCPVYVSDVNDLHSALEMILQVGLLVNAKLQAEAMVHQLVLDFDDLEAHLPETNLAVAYLIWRKPYMAAGGNTFISSMLQKCGFRNVFAAEQRYPTVTFEMLQTASPNVLLLSSEPYPFHQKHIVELQAHLPDTKILLVDGEMFSWYGSRLLKACHYFTELVKQLK